MSKEIGFKNSDRFIQLGITISVIRKMRGMSQEQLAAEAMMSRSHLLSLIHIYPYGAPAHWFLYCCRQR